MFSQFLLSDGTPLITSKSVCQQPANENRVLASITLDNSAVVTDALFARIHAVWDAAKVSVEDLAGGMAEGFIRTALQGLDLQV